MSEINLGIIGGGQLGSMLSVAAKKLNIKTTIYCNDKDAPAQNFCDEFIYSNYDNKKKILEFASKVDVVTYEFENIPYVTLNEITAGTLFGEMAIIDGSPRSASARAKEECVLKEITEDQLKAYMSRSPDTSIDMMRRLASYARSANEKLNKPAIVLKIDFGTDIGSRTRTTKSRFSMHTRCKDCIDEFCHPLRR